MKRLGKILALVLLVVVAIGFGKTVRNTFAANGYGEIKVNQCAINCKKVTAVSDPDINVKIRGFGRLNSAIGDDRLKLVPTCAAALDPELAEPRLCQLFSDKRTPAFTSLFAVGKANESGSPKPAELAPPHLLGMETKPHEAIFVPGIGKNKFIQEDYVAMVLFADNDSITLKYTNYDDYQDPGGSYEINIIGIDVDQALLNEYNRLNKGDKDHSPREYLPGVKANQAIGSAIGNQIWITMRDTGSFLDPRWMESWWRGCGQTNATSGLTDAQVKQGHPDGETSLANIGGPNDPPIHTSQSGTCPVVTGGEDSGTTQNSNGIYTDADGKVLGTVFPPIHSLEACPPEVPTLGVAGEAGIISGGSCQISPQGQTKIKKLLEMCANPKETKKIEHQSIENGLDFCNNGFADDHYLSINWCPGKYAKGLKEADVCQGKAIGVDYERLCDAPPSADTENHLYELIHSCGLDKINPHQKHVIEICQAYFNGFGEKINSGAVNNANDKTLPACVPNGANNSRCISECSPPVEVSENYRLYIGPIQNCINTRDCVLKMKLANPTIGLPFTKKLANYFAGTMDSGAVGDGSISSSELETIKQEVAQGNSEAADELFAKSGVAKKLLPADLQDRYKCQFIKETVRKIAKGENTKYKFYTDDTKTATDVFKIDGIRITEFELPPYFDKSLDVDPKEACTANFAGRTDKGEVDSWQETPSGKAWSDVPLFGNEDSQGVIEFTSPSLYSSNVAGGDPNFSKNPLGPVYISIPDIALINQATQALQQILVPPELITSQEQKVLAKTYPEGIGKPLQIIKSTERKAAGLKVNACVPIAEGLDSWKPYYSKNISNAYEAARSDPGTTTTEFDRGVMCKVPIVDGSPESKICVVGPDGQLFCYREAEGTAPSTGKDLDDKTQMVQVRTVFPNVFDIAEQTISPLTGLFRIFKPAYFAQNGNSLEARDEFEKPYDALPAASDPVKYEITGGYATINEDSAVNKDWRIFFYGIGGLWNARDFVLKLLEPGGTGSTKAL